MAVYRDIFGFPSRDICSDPIPAYGDVVTSKPDDVESDGDCETCCKPVTVGNNGYRIVGNPSTGGPYLECDECFPEGDRIRAQMGLATWRVGYEGPIENGMRVVQQWSPNGSETWGIRQGNAFYPMAHNEPRVIDVKSGEVVSAQVYCERRLAEMVERGTNIWEEFRGMRDPVSK